MVAIQSEFEQRLDMIQKHKNLSSTLQISKQQSMKNIIKII